MNLTIKTTFDTPVGDHYCEGPLHYQRNRQIMTWKLFWALFVSDSNSESLLYCVRDDLNNQRVKAELYNVQVLPAERQKACRNLLKEYYMSLTKHVVKDHKDLRNVEKQNWKILQVRKITHNL